MTSAVKQHEKFCPACRERFPEEALYCPNDGSPLVTSLAEDPPPPASRPDPYLGRTILDHIELRELAGIGAMGRVYRAFQKGIDRDVAVKVLHRELSANAQLVSRFLREAKVASRLQHPNVVHVLLSGQLPDGALYIVMEYLHGLSLQDAIAQSLEADGSVDAGGDLRSEGRGFDLSRTLHVVLQLCDAVGEAHVQGIVHRDLKPENVMLVRRGQDSDFVKVLDFGIARLNWSEQSMATATGLIFGTARYISPEGAQGDKVGPPGDVYSIATLTYQLLAGRTPFQGDQAVGLLIQQIHEPPPPLRSIARAHDVPPAIADVIMRALSKDPRARYDGAREFGRALVEAARSSGVSADDYYARSLFAARASGSMARATPPPSESNPRLGGSASETPPPAAPGSARDLGEAPLAGPTARWTPPAAVQAQLAAISGANERRRAPSQVDRTLDDDDQGEVRDARTAQRTESGVLGQRTEYTTPSAHALVTPSPTPQSFSGTVRLPAPSTPEGRTGAALESVPFGKGGTLPVDNGVPPVSERWLAPSTAGHGSTPDRAPSHGDYGAPRGPDSVRISSARPSEQDGAWRKYTALIVVLCFCLGVGGAIVLNRNGAFSRLFGGTVAPTSPALDSLLARARDALERERWDSPPGDNVRDLVLEGVAHWPNDPRIISLRTQASDTLIRRAVALKSSHDTAQAAHLASLASQIVPENDTTRALAAEYASELGGTIAPLPSPPTSLSPALPLKPTQATSTGAARVVLDASPAKPRVGQTVMLVARASGTKGPVSDPAFVVIAPGQPEGMRLVPVTEGNTFRASFTFLEAGRYEVSFVARAEGGALKTQKTLTVESREATPPPETPPAPTGSVKWL